MDFLTRSWNFFFPGQSENRCKRGLWFLAGLTIGSLLTVLAFLLFRPKQGGDASFLPAITFNFTVSDSGEVEEPPQPEGTGQSKPIIDTVYRVPSFLFFPDWSISHMRYDSLGLLEFVAVRQVKDEDSAHVEVRQEKHYAPGGFDLEVRGDDIRVDTFPAENLTRPQTPQHYKRKILRLSGLAELDTQDGLGAGVELSAWRMIRLQGLIGVGRVCHEAGVTKFPSNEKAPWVRLRLQIALP